MTVFAGAACTVKCGATPKMAARVLAVLRDALYDTLQGGQFGHVEYVALQFDAVLS